jgi:hypothetical protein
MKITKEDAAAMYARACRAWYGRRAPGIVQSKIQQLRRRGDIDGVQAWSEVAHQLSQMKAGDFDAERRGQEE